MTFFISHLHTDLRRTRLTKRGSTHDASQVPKGKHKVYPRMDRIILPAPQKLEMSLDLALLSRSSTMLQGGDAPLSVKDYGDLLGHALKKRDGSNSRNYPSGGALYPIETYVIATTFDGATPGVYHYDPTAHALERLWDLPASFEMTKLVAKPDFLMPSAVIIFTSVWKRSSAKYGDFTYGLSLLEAGHMSENIVLVSAALGLESRPMAGFNDQETMRLLDLDAEHEQPVHSVTLSKGARVSSTSNSVETAL